jgi:hypothetical protein
MKMQISKQCITKDHEFFIKLAVHNLACNEHGRIELKNGGVDYFINQRAALKARIDRCAVNGKIWVSQAGRDCDGSQYQWRAYQIPATLLDYGKEEMRIYESADGPVSLCIHQADNLPEPWSRDLALEAYEDGHSHVIYA